MLLLQVLQALLPLQLLQELVPSSSILPKVTEQTVEQSNPRAGWTDNVRGRNCRFESQVLIGNI